MLFTWGGDHTCRGLCVCAVVCVCACCIRVHVCVTAGCVMWYGWWMCMCCWCGMWWTCTHDSIEEIERAQPNNTNYKLNGYIRQIISYQYSCTWHKTQKAKNNTPKNGKSVIATYRIHGSVHHWYKLHTNCMAVFPSTKFELFVWYVCIHIKKSASSVLTPIHIKKSASSVLTLSLSSWFSKSQLVCIIGSDIMLGIICIQRGIWLMYDYLFSIDKRTFYGFMRNDLE
jgi:hypothetical protein